MSKQDQRRGRLAGRAWADSGRSINAVEAVSKFMHRDCEKNSWEETNLFDAMATIIGDDEEFDDLSEHSDAYIGAWYRAVVEIAQEWRK